MATIGENIHDPDDNTGDNPPADPVASSDALLLFVEMWRRGEYAYGQYTTESDPSYLDTAIQSFQIAAEVAQTENPDKLSALSYLALTLHERFKCTGEPQDLDEAISSMRLMASITPDDDSEKPKHLNNLASFIFSRFTQDGRDQDLVEAIDIWTSADELLSDDDTDKPALLNNLGNSLQKRYQQFGDVADFEKAIALQTRAVDLISDGDPNKPLLLNNLGNLLDDRFNQLGDLADLENAIRLNERSVSLTPEGHPNRPRHLNNAGSSLCTRCLRLGNVEDVDRAIVLQSCAVKLTPDSHPKKPIWLSSLSTSLETRYKRTKDVDNLQDAVAHQTRAVELTPAGHPDRSARLHNLGGKLLIRAQRCGSSEDLDKSITYLTEAAELVSEEHPDKPTRLHNLGMALRRRFVQVGGTADLEEAITCSTRSLELLPRNHGERAARLRLLGQLFEARLISDLSHTGDSKHALSVFLEAMRHVNSYPLERLQASLEYADLLSKTSQDLASILPTSPTLLQAYEHALSLIPQCVWLGNNVRGRYTSEGLRLVGAAVSDAATAAISAEQYHLALEWLETGRAVIWSQILQLRTPLDDLRQVDTQLADNLEHVAQALQYSAGSSTNSQSMQVSLDTQAQSSHSHALEYDRLVAQVRQLKGFERFMLPKTLTQLTSACASRHVVVINMHDSRCDALIFYHPGRIKHVPLPSFSLDHAIRLVAQLWEFLKYKHLLGRVSDKVQFETESRGARLGRKEDPDPMRLLLAELWSLVVKPIIDAIETLPLEPASNNAPGSLPHITWCPTGVLSFLPLHAAGIYSPSDPTTTAMDFIVSSYTPTLEALLKPRSQLPQNGSEPRALIVSQPFTPGCAPIPATVIEAQKVAAHINQTTVLGNNEGTVKATLDGMATHNWIHLACHGIQNREDPINSAFALHDGKLTLDMLMSRSLRDADLAVLSACQTATGDLELRDEAVHLAAGMLNVGYKSVVGTMWSISDSSAPILMEEFYKVLMAQVRAGGELKPAYALHEAIVVLRQKCNNEYNRWNWVPFVHFGL